MFRKAQGATEYLIILAVVIIIALIVIGAMGGIPGIGTGARQRASASYWQTADIAIPSYATSAATDTITLTAKNNLRNSISSLALTVEGTSLTCSATSLAPGQSTECSGTKACAAAGDSYSYDVSVTYIDDETGASYTFTGEGHKLEGKCAS